MLQGRQALSYIAGGKQAYTIIPDGRLAIEHTLLIHLLLTHNPTSRNAL